jgi:hypothetical protein
MGRELRTCPTAVPMEPWEDEEGDDGEWVGGWKRGYGAPEDGRGGERVPEKLAGELERESGGGKGGAGAEELADSVIDENGKRILSGDCESESHREEEGEEEEGGAATAGAEAQEQMERRLYAFYGHVNVSKAHDVPRIASAFATDLTTLNQMLKVKYGISLTEFECQQDERDAQDTGEFVGAEGDEDAGLSTTSLLKKLAVESSLVDNPNGGGVGKGDEEEMLTIHKENMRRVNQMSPEERQQVIGDLQATPSRTVLHVGTLYSKYTRALTVENSGHAASTGPQDRSPPGAARNQTPQGGRREHCARTRGGGVRRIA